MTCTAAIINWNSGELLRPCVDSIFATTPEMDVLVIDNASVDGSVESLSLASHSMRVIRNSSNRGFPGGANQAFTETTTPYVLILNPDIRVTPGAVAQLREFLDLNPNVGAVGGNVNQKYLPRKTASTVSLVRENLGFQRLVNQLAPDGKPVSVEQPAAAALMIRREAFGAIGGFDEQFQPCWYEDVDFCKRLLAAGWEIYFMPSARFIHEGGYSARLLGSEGFAAAYYRNQLRYARKHMGVAGRLAVRAAMIAGMIGRAVAHPAQIRAYGGVLWGALGRW